MAWPAGAVRYNPPAVAGAVLRLDGWARARGRALWFSPETGAAVANTTGRSVDGVLSLPVPTFNDDLVAIVR